MKKVIYILVAVSLTACGSRQSKENKTEAKDTVAQAKKEEPKVDLTVPALPADYVKTSLAKTGLKATMMTPKKVDMQKSELDDNQGDRPEYILNAFNIPTGDAEHDKTFGGLSAEIELYTTQWDLKKHTDYIRTSVISGFKRVLKEGADYIMYTTQPNNTSTQPLRAKDKEVYHFLMVVKNDKDNKSYCVRSNDSFDFSREEMLQLFAIAQTIEWK